MNYQQTISSGIPPLPMLHKAALYLWGLAIAFLALWAPFPG